jgi:hypothetical protein
MKTLRPAHTSLVLLLGFLVVAGSPCRASDDPYIVVTTNGTQLKALRKPTIEGKVAKLLLFPDGALATYQVARIDWPATEKANVGPRPTPTMASWDVVNKHRHGAEDLNKVAEKSKVDDEKATAKASDYGKLKSADGESWTISTDGAGLAGNSVQKYVQLTNLSVDSVRCPWGSAKVTATFKNISIYAARHLVAVFIVPTGTSRPGRPAPMSRVEAHLQDLLPGGEAAVGFWIDCEGYVSSGGGDERVMLQDITGSIEQKYPWGDQAPSVPPPDLPSASSTPTPKPAPTTAPTAAASKKSG